MSHLIYICHRLNCSYNNTLILEANELINDQRNAQWRHPNKFFLANAAKLDSAKKHLKVMLLEK